MGSPAQQSVLLDCTTLMRLELVSGQESLEGEHDCYEHDVNHNNRDDCITEDEEPRQRKKKQKGTSGPDTTTRKPAEALANGFKCPGGPIGVHPALPHPKDCRMYYVCLDGITPSAAGCTHGKVFNPTTQQCDIPTNVEGEILSTTSWGSSATRDICGDQY